VKLRVELGPKDLEINSCVLAVCTKPGEVAEKKSVTFGEALLASTGEVLGRKLSFGDYEPKPFQVPKQPVKGKHMSFQADEEGEGGGEEEGAEGKDAAKVRESGDGLGDDFLLDGEVSERSSRKKDKPVGKKKKMTF